MTGVGKLSANDASVTITTGRSFTEFVTRSTSDRDSLVCVGLDPDLSRMPESIVSGRSAGAAIVEFNKRIIDASAKKLHIAPQKVVLTGDRHGNTSAASIPLALATAADDGRIKTGDLVMLEAMGGGFTWGSALLRW